MRIASLHNVTTHYGAQPVLTGASFEINSGQKLGLIGPNGSGKTTILKVLTGREPVTGGSVYLDPGVRVGYVPQHFEHDTDSTVTDWLLRDYRPIADALHDQEDALARSSAADMDGALRAYQRARDAYDRIDGDSWPRRAQALLDAFGLGGKERQRVTSLSGGEKNVLSLAQALLSEPDLLLLDEPANHLDYLGVAWLEDFLVKFGGRSSSSPTTATCSIGSWAGYWSSKGDASRSTAAATPTTAEKSCAGSSRSSGTTSSTRSVSPSSRPW